VEAVFGEAGEMTHVERAMLYLQQVLSGEIPACRWVRLACERQFDDLARQRTEDFPYYFDEAAGEAVCEFVELCSHVKGPWAVKKRGDPDAGYLRLESWQSFVIIILYGWKCVDDDSRRFREAFLLLPKKNGKSTLMAPLQLYHLTSDGEEGGEVYCGATSRDQAMNVFSQAWHMVAKDPEMQAELDLLLTGTDSNPTGIHQRCTHSFYKPLIGKPGDGTNPSCAVIDEFHEHADNTMVTTMRLGGVARRQPLLIYISTAGDDISGPCYTKQQDCQDVLNGLARADDLFVMLWGLDDDDPWDTIESARKANPNFGVSVTEKGVLSELAEARRSPLKRADYETKRLNRWVGSRQPFFNLQGWLDLGDTTLSEADFAGDDFTSATDAAAKLDLCSTVNVYRRMLAGEMHYFLFARHYLPEERIDSPDNPNKMYRAWANEGYLIATPGARTDLGRVEADILTDAQRGGLLSWSYDPYYLTQMSQRLQAEGITVVETIQNVKNHSNPMLEWEALIESGRIHHTGDPVLAWAVGNTTARRDANGNVYPRKEKDDKKIDPVVAGIMALGRSILDDGTRKKSIYERRDPVVF
jgi:phage terminase large subunit-like protein